MESTAKALPSPRLARWVLAARLASVLAFRSGCYAVMLWLALLAEARPAPALPDALLSWVPYVPQVARYNYHLWLASYVPVAAWLALRDFDRFCRYMVSSGLVALLRGLCIVATGLGPVRGPDVNAGLSEAARLSAFAQLASPFGFVSSDAPQIYLTKDLFFSGHVATTFLLLLYVWRFARLRWVMLGAHLVVLISVFLAHLHYTIDVLGAYAVTLALFAVREVGWKRLVGEETKA